MSKIKLNIILLFILLAGTNVSAQVLIDWNSSWSYFKGTEEPSVPNTLWTTNDFNDSVWLVGNAPFRYGEGEGGTLLSDMFGNYTSFYIRNNFSISNVDELEKIEISANYDDGFAIWINGKLVLQNNAPRRFEFDQLAPHNHDTGEIETYLLAVKDAYLQNGKNIIAIQGFNTYKASNDFFLNVKLNALIKLPETAGSVSCDKPSGFYNAPFSAEITGENAGDKIKYTLDGSNPRNSLTVLTGTSPLSVSIDPNSTEGGRGKTGGVILRASAYMDGFAPGKPITRSFIFVGVVKTQEHPGGSWPTTNVNGQKIDLPMDSKVTSDSRYKNLIESSLLDIPSISVTTDSDNLFGSQDGIYVNAQYHGAEWERPANIELINPDGSKGFNIDAGIRIRGGWSRHDGYPKHAFRLFFRSEYGEGKLNFPLFGNEGADEYDKIDLRCSQNYSWANGGGDSRHNTMNRDVFSRDSQRDMNQPYTRSRYYHLYLNGLYWGVYQTQERAEASFAASYFGGDKDDYDVIKVDIGDNFNLYDIEATDGNTDKWEEVWNITQQGYLYNLNYFKLLGLGLTGKEDTTREVYVDIDNFIDYMLTIFYAGNFDAPASKFSDNRNPNNFFVINDRTKKREGFKFLTHDSEHTLLTDPAGPGIGLTEDRVNIDLRVNNFWKFHPQWLHEKLSENTEYRMHFADRVYLHFFNKGVFTPDSCITRFKKTADMLDLAIIAESARWGDQGSWPARNKIDDWLPAVNRVINDYMPFRTEIVLGQLKTANLYVDQQPPIYKNNGTEITDNTVIVSGSYNLTIENPNTVGSIIYTTDGLDPRAIGGSNSSSAIVAGSVKNIVVSAGTKIKARIKNGTIWSALHELNFDDSGLFSNLKVTELHYHPVDMDTVGGKQLEFIELKNIGTSVLDLSGLSFTDGITYTFPDGTTLAPKTFIVVASNAEEFARRYGFSTNHTYSGSLSNGGEQIVLETNTNQIVISFAFSDTIPWPVEPDGEGYSLVSAETNPTGDPNQVEYWAVSKYINGSPMADDENSIITNSTQLIANKFELEVYPNPTSSYLNVDFTLDFAEKIEIGLYDINGRLLQTLVNEYLPEGFHNKFIQLSNLNIKTGLYLLAFKSKNNFVTKKLVIKN